MQITDQKYGITVQWNFSQGRNKNLRILFYENENQKKYTHQTDFPIMIKRCRILLDTNQTKKSVAFYGF